MPGRPPNGEHAEAEAERNVAASVRARADTMDIREVGTEALVKVELHARTVRGFLGSLSVIKAQQSEVLAHTSRLSEVATEEMKELRREMRDGFVRTNTILEEQGRRTEQLIRDHEERISNIEQERASLSSRRGPDDSNVDLYEQVSDPKLAERLSESRRRDLTAIMQLQAREEQREAEITTLLAEKKTRELEDAAVARHEAKLALKRAETRKAIGDFVKLAGGIFAIVAAIYGAYQVISPHVSLGTIPTPTPSTSTAK